MITPQLIRYSHNPILSPTENSWENRSVFNCAAAIYNNNIVLLYRAQGDDMISRFGMATLQDGVIVTERSSKPVFEPDPLSQYESLGVEDPRITQIGDTYYIVYTAASAYPPLVSEPKKDVPGLFLWRVRVSLAYTTDFKSFTRKGVIINHIDSKDATLFPEKINNQYVLLHRVHPTMRMAVSEDLSRFKERGTYIAPWDGRWDGNRVGAGAQPIKTPYGWLLIYHGVDEQMTYRLGFILADLADPSRILLRTDEPVLSPEKPYEKLGLVPNVVFTCGAVEFGEHIYVYYGGADSTISLATIEKTALYEWLKSHLVQA